MPHGLKTVNNATNPVNLAFKWLIVVGLGFIGVYFSLASPAIFGIQLKAGDMAIRDFRAKDSTIIDDPETTEKKVEEARLSVVPVLVKSHFADDTCRKKLKEAETLISLYQSESKNSKEHGLFAWNGEVEKLCQGNEALKSSLIEIGREIKPKQLSTFYAAVESTMNKMLRLGNRLPDESSEDWVETAEELMPEGMDIKQRQLGGKLISLILEPNMIHDANLTHAKVRIAEAAVKPQIREIKSGELIAKQGKVLSDSDIVILNAMGVTHVTNFPLAINIAYSLFAAFVVFALFLQHFYEKHFYSPQSLGLMFTVAIFACLAADFAGKTSPAFVPIPAEALILTVFFGRGVAFALTLITMTFLGLVNVINPIDLIALGVSSFIAIASYVKDRKSLMFRGFSIGLIQGITFLTVSVLTSSKGISSLEIGPAVVLHIIGGVSSCIIAIGSLPFLENIFGLLTPARIAELTDADQPLLRHLEENAPGTYQHSLAVANLAEAAAKAIHADCNLARAGALYHDIGKMVRPKYFIENQLGDKNPHDGIPPEESRDRVLAHVTDGIALARRYGLPEAIQAFIPQHQGTTLMAYFYHKACLRDGIDNVDAMFYRYPGPKPQNKEAAIVMLADVTEAVTHSMHEPTQEEVEHALDKVFKNRWDDGQFIEAGLSVEEFEKIKQSFGRVWKTLHHERLKYPSTTTGKMPIVPPPDQKQEKEVKISRTLGKDSQESDSEPGKIDVKTKSSQSKKRPK